MSSNRNFDFNVSSFQTVLESEKEGLFLRFLYHTFLGRCILWILIRPWFSKLVGSFLNTKLSKIFIKGFIKKNNIFLERYKTDFTSFNDFFARSLKYLPKIGRSDFISPCDGKLRILETHEIFDLKMKHSRYELRDLLGKKELEERYHDGICLVFRLTPDDYHRYHFLDDGHILEHFTIPGVFHTVRPIAMKEYPVYFLNQREITVMETKRFGIVTQVEVGALCVGKICNLDLSNFKKGEEKGKFLFGGSTILLFLEKEQVHFSETLLSNTKANKETIIHFGDVLGVKKK